MSAIDDLPPLREVDRRPWPHRPIKALGQNFLMDLNLTARIARLGGASGARILEVGPGPGGLTRALLAEGAEHVLAVEKDVRCLPVLAQIADAWPGRLTVVEADALSIDPALHLAAPWRVVSNLPYNVGTELLVRWLTPPAWPPPWSSLTLMFQHEVAERIVAAPGSKSYGRLAVLAQWRCEARIAMTLPPEAFTPPPKVRSAVVRLDALPAPRFAADAAVLERVVAAGFGQRRKMLRASLRRVATPRGAPVEEVLRAVGIDPTDRAERVPLEAWCALARALDAGAA